MIKFFKVLKDTSRFYSPTISTQTANVGKDAYLYLGMGPTREEYLSVFGLSGTSQILIQFNMDDYYVANTFLKNINKNLSCYLSLYNNDTNNTLYQNFDANVGALTRINGAEGCGTSLENKTNAAANWLYYRDSEDWPKTIITIGTSSSIFIDKAYQEEWGEGDITNVILNASSCTAGFLVDVSYDTMDSASAEINNYTTFVSSDNLARKPFGPLLVVIYDDYCQDNTHSLRFGTTNGFGFSDYDNIIAENAYTSYSFSLLNDNNELLYTLSGSISSLEYNATYSQYSLSALIPNSNYIDSYDYYVIWNFENGGLVETKNVKLAPQDARFLETDLFVDKESYTNYETGKVYTVNKDVQFEAINKYLLLSNEAYYRIYHYDKDKLKNYYLTKGDRMSYKDNYFFFRQDKENMTAGTYYIEFKIVMDSNIKTFAAEGYNFNVIEQ